MHAGDSKDTIIFIHGLANYAPVWKHQFDIFKDKFTCIAIDLPGNGLSPAGNYPYSMFFYAESVKQFIDLLNIQGNIYLAGHSMGGQVALMLSLRYPSIFNKLILFAPAGIEYFAPHEVLLLKNLMAIGDIFYSDELHIKRAISDSFAKPGETSTGIINDIISLSKQIGSEQWKKMTIDSIYGMLNEQINRFLPQVSADTLLLFGDKDHFIPNPLLHPTDSPKSIAMQGAALIPKCSMHLIEGAGHFVQIEKHNQVNQLIKDWIQTHQ